MNNVKYKMFLATLTFVLFSCLGLGVFSLLSPAHAYVKEGKCQAEDVVIIDSFDDYTSVCEYGAATSERNTSITSINGKTSMGGGVSSFPEKFNTFWNPVGWNDSYDEATKSILNETEDKQVISNGVNAWGFSIFNDVTFKSPVQLDESTNTLIFRMYLHLSSSNTYCLENGSVKHGNLGIWIYGIGDTGAVGEGVMIPFDVTQDRWINFEISGDDAYKLADENGVVRGFIFASGVIDNDKPTVLYKTDNMIWIDRVSKGFRVVKSGRTIMGGNGDWSQSTTANKTAKSVEGVTAMGGGVNSFEFPDFSWASLSTNNETFKNIKGETDDINVIGHIFNAWGFTVSRAITFVKPISRANIDGITFRIAAHLSSGSTYGIVGENPPNGGTGIYFFAPDSDGSKGTGVLLPYDIVQDEWVDFIITGEDLNKLTDSNGMISGFYLAAGVISENNAVMYGYKGDFDNSAYLLIDSVKVNNRQSITYFDGDSALQTVEMFTGEKPFYVPEKDGYSFIGWTVNSDSGRILGANEEFSLDITSLYAQWTTAGDLRTVSGLYGNADGNYIMVFNDGSVRFDQAFGKVLYYSYGADGVLYAFTAEERLDIAISSLIKKDSVEVTYMDGEFGEILYYKTRIEKGLSAENLANNNPSFEFWSKELYGRQYAFSENLTEDIVLYAVNRYGTAEAMVVTGNNDFREGETWLLNSIAGCTAMNSGTAIIANPTFKFQFRINCIDVSSEAKWAGSDDGKAFSMLIGPWGFSLGKPILFANPVQVKNYDSITFRIFAHLSPTSPYGGELWGGAGVRIFGAHSDGSDSGVLIPLDITQDEWVDLTVSKDLLNVLADEDGYMYGFTIGAAIVVDTSVEKGKDRWYTEFDWITQDINKSTYVLVDYITLSSEKTLSFVDSDGSVLKSQKFIGGEPVDLSFIPEKDGKVFTGWTAYEQPLDYSEIFYSNVNIYANWIDASDIKAATGLYTKTNGEEISIFNDGTINVSGVSGTLCYGLGTDGILYVANENGIYKFVLSEYQKSDAHQVTVDEGNGNVSKFLVASGNTFNENFTRNGYVVDKILNSETQQVFVMGQEAVVSDLNLFVVWKYDEISDYESVKGRYYCSDKKVMLELKDDNSAVYDGIEYRYFVLNSDEIVIENFGSGTYNGTFIEFDGNFIKLGKYIVSFDTGKGNPTIESQTVDEQNYKVIKPKNPEITGYRFVCWMTADGQEFDFDTVITGSIQLFAKWEKISNVDPVDPSPIPDNSENKSGCRGNIESDSAIIIGVLTLAAAIFAVSLKRKNI